MDEAVILQIGGDSKSILVTGLATKPTADVEIVAVAPLPTIEVLYPGGGGNVRVPAEKWNNYTCKITIRALRGTSPGMIQVQVQPTSADPKYNTSVAATAINIVIPEVGFEPTTNITTNIKSIEP